MNKKQVQNVAEEFTLAPMRRLIKKHGDLKVSEEAAEEMRRAVGELAQKIAEAAADNAKKDNRKTVLERDIRAARLREIERE
jgi:histone H3/H4